MLAEVLPEEKSLEVRTLQDEGKIVAMVGAGMNDAPALAQADVGIAIGTGTDVAIEAADVSLIPGDLNGVGTAIVLSRATMRNIKQNLFSAFAYSTLGVPVAAGVLYSAIGLLLSPMIAAAAMSLSSLSVVANANRLRRFRTEQASAACALGSGDREDSLAHAIRQLGILAPAKAQQRPRDLVGRAGTGGPSHALSALSRRGRPHPRGRSPRPPRRSPRRRRPRRPPRRLR